MPYKDPEHKRNWEREHREERNARRRKQPLTVQLRVHDPLSPRETTASWTVAAAIGGVMVAVGMVLLAAWRGVSRSSTGS
jgi:ferric-dicitrate binding protein FerR (iron transport regulator)